MENTFIILQKKNNVNYGLHVFAYFASRGWKEELEKKGRKKLDKEEDASDRGGDGDDADRNNADVLPWQGFVF